MVAVGPFGHGGGQRRPARPHSRTGWPALRPARTRRPGDRAPSPPRARPDGGRQSAISASAHHAGGSSGGFIGGPCSLEGPTTGPVVRVDGGLAGDDGFLGDVEHGEVLADDHRPVVLGTHVGEDRADGVVVDDEVPHGRHERAGAPEDLARHRRAATRGRDRPRRRAHELRGPRVDPACLHEPCRRHRHPRLDVRRCRTRAPGEPPVPDSGDRPPRWRGPSRVLRSAGPACRPRLPSGWWSAAELLDHAAGLFSDSAGLVRDNERR